MKRDEWNFLSSTHFSSPMTLYKVALPGGPLWDGPLMNVTLVQQINPLAECLKVTEILISEPKGLR